MALSAKNTVKICGQRQKCVNFKRKMAARFFYIPLGWTLVRSDFNKLYFIMEGNCIVTGSIKVSGTVLYIKLVIQYTG